MSEHTKGLLECSSAGHGTKNGIVTDEYFIRRPGDDVAVAADIADPETGKPSEANARRLVACWNACDGISTAVLELKATAGGIATLERQRDNYRAVLEGAEYRDIEGIGRNSVEDSRLVGETAKACTLDIIRARDLANAQCDELISAFEEVLRISDREHDAWDRARAAIAKAKGGAQ